jgi:N-acetylmuramoyl-L-alanine amidase
MPAFEPDSAHVDAIMASPNHDPRLNDRSPDILLLHYTGMQSTEAALARLCDPQAEVSSHYLVFEDGAIWQLVPEARRARHAGVSSWEQSRDINSRSIGIEIGNPGHAYDYPEFPARQMEAVVRLCRDIVMRHRIRSDRVLGHSDVAPSRKQDPGEKFPWRVLHDAGVGLWVEPDPLADKAAKPSAAPHILELQRALARYGYGIEATSTYDHVTAEVVTAFQRHFRPRRVDGIADGSTIATLDRLLAAKEALTAGALP